MGHAASGEGEADYLLKVDDHSMILFHFPQMLPDPLSISSIMCIYLMFIASAFFAFD